MVSKKDIISFIKNNNLDNSIICLHSSLKSIGKIEQGPNTIIDAFRNTNCTLVCPSFYYKSQTYPTHQNYKRNGIDYSNIDEFHTVSFNDDPNQIETSMGIVPKSIMEYKEAVRTKNPVDSFVLLGDKSENLIQNQSLLDVYSVYKKIYKSKHNAYIMLAGVTFKSCTPIHFAEEKSGRKLFRRWAVYYHQIVEIEDGSCSDGFDNLREYTRSIETIGYIGKSEIRIYPFKEFVNIVAEIIHKKPQITHCNNENCDRCNDMILGGRI